MQELIKADIFFFITAIAVVLIAIGIGVALFYIVRILRNIRDVTERVDEGSKVLVEGLSELRSTIKREGFVWGHVFGFLKKQSGLFGRKTSGKRKGTTHLESDGEPS